MTRIRQRDDGTWEARIQIRGERPRIYGRTKGDVERKIAELKNAAHRANLGLPVEVTPRGQMTLAELTGLFFDAYRRSPRSRESLEERLKYAEPLMRKQLRELTSERIEGWYWGLAGRGGAELSASTRHGAFRSLSQVLRWGVSRHYLAVNPATQVEVEAPTERDINPFASWEQIRAVAAHGGPTWGPWLRFACGTGLRPQEWRALDWQAVNIADRTLRVMQTVRSGRIQPIGKTRNALRTVQLQQEAVNALSELPRPITGRGLIFQANHESNFRRRIWTPMLGKAGVEYRSLDQTRHTYATLALSAGAPIEWVSAQMGHADIRTTLKHYARWQPEADARNIALLDAHAQNTPTAEEAQSGD